MTSNNLRELESVGGSTFEERPEIVDLAITLLVGDPSGERGDGLILPMDGPEAEREIAKRYEMTTRNARRYVGRARELIAAEFTADLPHRARALSGISLAVVREAYKDRNWPGVNGAVRNLCTIYGIDKVTLGGDNGLSALMSAAKVDPGARDDEIAKLEAADKAAADKPDGPDAG